MFLLSSILYGMALAYILVVVFNLEPGVMLIWKMLIAAIVVQIMGVYFEGKR